LEAVTERSV